jgi:hypothetical protein
MNEDKLITGCVEAAVGVVLACGLYRTRNEPNPNAALVATRRWKYPILFCLFGLGIVTIVKATYAG